MNHHIKTAIKNKKSTIEFITWFIWKFWSEAIYGWIWSSKEKKFVV